MYLKKRIRTSLQFRLSIHAIMLLLLFVLSNIVLTWFLLEPFSIAFVKRHMNRLADTIGSHLDLQGEELDNYIEEIAEQNNMSIAVLKKDYSVVSSTRTQENKKRAIEKAIERYFQNERERVKNGEIVFYERELKNVDGTRITSLKKVRDDRYILLVRSHRSMQNSSIIAILFEILVGVCLLIVGILLLLRICRGFAKPIEDMQKTAEAISRLDFSNKVQVEGEDEFAKLAETINVMSDRLEDNLDTLQNDIEKRKQLVNDLTHEIKTPIAIIMGYAERLQKKPERVLEYSEIIAKESSRVNDMVAEMLDLAKMESDKEPLKQKEIPLPAFIDDLAEHFRVLKLDREADLTLSFDDTETIYADETLLKRALFNLLKNTLVHGPATPFRVCFSGRTVGDYYEFQVFNSGSHINPENADAIWDSFAKEDKSRTRSKTGYGIGLSIVKTIITRHGGYYRVCNKEDGVCFIVSVPVKELSAG